MIEKIDQRREWREGLHIPNRWEGNTSYIQTVQKTLETEYSSILGWLSLTMNCTPNQNGQWMDLLLTQLSSLFVFSLSRETIEGRLR